MNEYIRPPFRTLDFLEGIYIFAAPNEKNENVKAFNICNGWARLLVVPLVKAMNGEYPGELETEGLRKIAGNIKEFIASEEHIEVILKNDKTLKLLKIRGWGMLTGHGVGAFGLDPDKAYEVQKEVLGFVVDNLNSILLRFKEKNSLKSRMNGFRAITDSIRLEKDQYVLIMCDGHCFSHYVKNKYKLPFDQSFIDHMNKAAIEAAKHIQGFLFAYVQSDEISFLIHRREGSPFFDYRLQKMVSLVASWVSTAFMSELYKEVARTPASAADIQAMIEDISPLVFDGRAFNLPTDNDAFAWFLWRQNDCVRNSKQQAAQTYLSHNQLKKKHTDEQVKLLLETTGIDWNNYRDGEKYGRLIYRETVEKQTENGEPYIRTIWPVHEVTGQFGDELRKMIRDEK